MSLARADRPVKNSTLTGKAHGGQWHESFPCRFPGPSEAHIVPGFRHWPPEKRMMSAEEEPRPQRSRRDELLSSCVGQCGALDGSPRIGSFRTISEAQPDEPVCFRPSCALVAEADVYTML